MYKQDYLLLDSDDPLDFCTEMWSLLAFFFETLKSLACHYLQNDFYFGNILNQELEVYLFYPVLQLFFCC